LDKTNCFFLGKIKKPNGLSGALEVFLDVDNPKLYLNLEFVLAERHHQLVPLFFSRPIQVAGQKFIARFKTIEHIDQATEWAGSDLYLPMEFLPVLHTDQQYYYHELPGYLACTPDGIELGTVFEVMEHGPLRWLVVHRNGQEALLPLSDEVFVRVDRETKRFYLHLKPGMEELYPFLFEG